jgi:hypothetical protein
MRLSIIRKPKQHVRIEIRDGITVYSTGFWSGWHELIGLCFCFVLFGAILVAILFAMHHINHIVDEFIEIPWLHIALSFFFGLAFDVGFLAFIALIVAWIPYFLIYQLSPKRFWIKDDVLYHTAYLLGFIPRKRTITFEQILNVQAEECNGRHAVEVLYERKLPKLIFIILVYWNEKLTQWSMNLVNGIPTMEEAEKIQNTLLEPMTDSDVCRVGS